jgi:hypothetical protein
VCQSCEVRFYDLSRDPIVCPACGAHNVVGAQLVVTLGGRGVAAKTAASSKPFKRLKPALPIEPEPDSTPDTADDAPEEAPAPAGDHDLVLEQETDESDVTDLVDRDAVRTKDS